MMVRRQNWLHRCASHTTDPHNRQTRGRRCRSLITAGTDSRLNTHARLRTKDANGEGRGGTPLSPFGSAIKLALTESGDARGAGRPRATAVVARMGHSQARTATDDSPVSTVQASIEEFVDEGDTNDEEYTLSPRRRLKIKCRNTHRKRFWENHDPGEYVCPMCGRDRGDETGDYDVHHRDGDALNGHPINLVAICYPCHSRTHLLPRRVGRLDEWKAEFAALGEETG